MFYREDYIMRQIHNMTRLIARLLFNKDIVQYEILDEAALTEGDLLHQSLLHLLRDGKFNEAEDLLFHQAEPGNPRFMAVAIDFYERLNALDDATLEAGHFTREEARAGLAELAGRYGIELE